MLNRENLKEQLINLSASDKVALVGDINGWDGSLDELRIENNDEEFFEVYYENRIMELVRALSYGDYNYQDDYVRIDVYGNLKSLNDYEFEAEFDNAVDEIIDWLEERWSNIDLNYYGLELEGVEEKTNEPLYQTLEEIQNTIEERKLDSNFNYYDNDDVCIIHIKFGDMKKAYCGLNNAKDDYFIGEFEKFFWDDKSSDFVTHWDVLKYVKENNLPIIFYQNFYEKEASFEDTIRYFITEKGLDNVPEYFINNYSYIIKELENDNKEKEEE